MKLVFLDTETTGLDRYKHEIIELALIVIEDGVRTVEQSWKLKPRRIETADKIALDINGYNEQLWKEQGYSWSKEACERLKIHLNGSVVIGHNIQFDIGFLRQVFKEYGVSFRFPPQMDTRALARLVWGFESLKMDNIRQNVDGMTTDGGHRALKDTEDCVYIYEKFVEKLNKSQTPIV